jgi:hypothetical protein
MNNLFISALLQSAVVPLSAALIASALFRRRGMAGAGALIGFLAAFVAILGLPSFPPVGSMQRLAVMALAALLAGVAAEAGRAAPRRLAQVALLSLAAGLVWLAWPRLGGGLAVWLRLAAVGAAGALLLARLATGETVAVAAAMTAMAVGISGVALVGDSASVAQLAGALAAGLVGVLAWHWRRRGDAAPAVGVMMAAAVVLALLAGQALTYTKASPAALSLLLLAPIGELLVWRRSHSADLGVVAAVGAVAVAAAVLLAFLISGADLYLG